MYENAPRVLEFLQYSDCPDNAWQELKNWITKASNESCGKFKYTGKKSQLWNQELQGLQKEFRERVIDHNILLGHDCIEYYR